MIQKKICMVGGFAVGKTSLVQRFVHSIFSEKYKTTVGVKIDKKVMNVNRQDLTLILWDLHGEDDFQELQRSYLRGTSGYFLVVDGTRPVTLDRARHLQQAVEETIGVVPFVLLLNKSDLEPEWGLVEADVNELSSRGWALQKTSANIGMGVEEAYNSLSSDMLLESNDRDSSSNS